VNEKVKKISYGEKARQVKEDVKRENPLNRSISLAPTFLDSAFSAE
jgi:hypothetical protein